MKKGIFLFISIAVLILSTGCTRCNTQMAVPVAAKEPQANTSKVIYVQAEGVGVVSCNGENCNSAQAVAMARRAAILDGYKALAEKIYGIRISGRDSVKNMVLKNSTLRAYVEGLIKNANIVDEEFKNGIYKVVMQINFKICGQTFCDIDKI